MSATLLKPKIIRMEEIAPYHAKVLMEPFERGYAHTLGNALRRVMLSSIEGYAATQVKIEGALHEYTHLSGVKEDMVDVLLNLKGVVFRLYDKKQVSLFLKKDAPW